jgi:hypothetical protein
MLFEYNAESLTIPNGRNRLPVTIRLLTRQYKCDMNKYLYCFFYDMPSMTFTGDASLTFLNILVDYP